MSEYDLIPDAPDTLLPTMYILIGLFSVVGLPLFVAEIVALIRARRLDRTRIVGLVTSSFCLLPATLLELGLGKELVAVAEAIASISPWSIPTTWATALLCLLLADFVYYWEHRVAHRVHVLWAAYHSVHHSANHYDQSIGLRVSFMDFFFSPLFYVPLVLLGFNPILVLMCLGFVLAYQQWIHTETIGAMPWLDGWLNTPANHRVHHGRNAGYIDRNYGGVLIIWDRLFGTYAPETEAVDFGLVERLERQDPISVHFHGLGQLALRVLRARSARELVRVVLGPPEWSK